MKCRCKAKPAPVVTWYRGTTVISESEKIAIKSSSTEEDIYELVLEIKVSERNFMAYVVHADKIKFFCCLGSECPRWWYLSLPR